MQGERLPKLEYDTNQLEKKSEGAPRRGGKTVSWKRLKNGLNRHN